MILFLFFYILNYILLYFTLYKSKFLSYPNPLTILLILYFISNHISLILLYIYHENYKQLSNIDQEVVIQLSLINCIFTLICGSIILSKPNLKLNKIINSAYHHITYPTSRIFVLFLFLICCSCAFFSYFRFLDSSALLFLLQGNDLGNVKETRLSYYSQTPTVIGIPLKYLNAFFMIYDVLLIYILTLSIVKKKLIFIILSLILSFSLLLWNLSNTSKGYVIVPFFFIILIILYRYNIRKILITCFIIISIVIFLSSLVTYFFLGTESILLWYPFERLCSANLLPKYIIFDYFNIHNMLLGQSLPEWFSFFNHDQFILAEWNWKYMNDSFHKDNYYQNPSSFIAELYANFNYLGIIFLPLPFFYIIFFCVLICKFFPRNSRFVLIIYLSFYFSKYSRTEFFNKFLDYRLCCTLLISFVFFYIILKLNKSKFRQ